MKVICRLLLRDEDENPIPRLEVELNLPIDPFPGLNVLMPYPKSWGKISGGFSGEVVNVEVVGTLVYVNMNVSDACFGKAAISELREIGYMDDVAEEKQNAAWKSLER